MKYEMENAKVNTVSSIFSIFMAFVLLIALACIAGFSTANVSGSVSLHDLKNPIAIILLTLLVPWTYLFFINSRVRSSNSVIDTTQGTITYFDVNLLTGNRTHHSIIIADVRQVEIRDEKKTVYVPPKKNSNGGYTPGHYKQLRKTLVEVLEDNEWHVIEAPNFESARQFTQVIKDNIGRSAVGERYEYPKSKQSLGQAPRVSSPKIDINLNTASKLQPTTKIHIQNARKEPILKRADSSADTKICPYCAEEIKKNAILCRYCGKDV